MIFPFLSLALKRMRELWALSLLSLLAIVLTIGLLASIPIFTDAVGLSILKQELADKAFGNKNPAMAMRFYRLPSAPEPMAVQEALDIGAWLRQLTASEVGLPVSRAHTQIGSHSYMLRALPDDARYANKEMRTVRINCVPGIEGHLEVLEGRPFADADTADELLLWAQPAFLTTLGLQVGEVFGLFNENANNPAEPLRFRVAGTWRPTDPEGAFWYRDPRDLMGEEFLTSVGAFARFVAPVMPQQIDFTFWYCVFDDQRIRFDLVDDYVKGVEVSQVKAQRLIPSLQVDRSPTDPLTLVQQRTRIMKRLLYSFSMPILVLLLFFIGLIAAITLRYQQNEVAVLMGRGTSSSQVLIITAMEGVIQALLGLPLGALAAGGIARAMSLASGFLAFTRADPLPITLYALDWRTVALALFIALAARLLPALRNSQRTIVTYGRERARPSRGVVAIRVLLTLALAATAAYSYYRLRQRGTLGLISFEPAGAVNDPLLFLAPTLFVMSTSVLAAQFFPLVMRLLDLIGSLQPSTTFYMALRNLSRESGTYTIPLFLVITCLSLGAFDASIARSADVWLVDRWRYMVGADYSFEQTTEQGPFGTTVGADAWLLPASDFAKLPGATDATRIGVFKSRPTTGRAQDRDLDLLGIDRLDFARVAYFREDYAPVSLGALLNLLGAQRDGVLVTPRFLEDNSLQIGDVLPLNVMIEFETQPMEFRIVGTYDYFPTVYESKRTAVLANLEYINDQAGGTFPHTIWLRTEPGMDELTLREGLKRMGVATMRELNGRALLEKDQARMERVGIYGNLSVGFYAGSALACLGVLVYTLASLIGRVHRFTILRAIGLGLPQLLLTVSIEYLGVVLYGIVVGAAVGVTTAQLFVPYFQFTDDPSLQVPPFTPYVAYSQVVGLVLGYLAVLALAEVIILTTAARRNVFQALRLGFRE